MQHFDENRIVSPTPTLSDDDYNEMQEIISAYESIQIRRHDPEWMPRLRDYEGSE